LPVDYRQFGKTSCGEKSEERYFVAMAVMWTTTIISLTMHVLLNFVVFFFLNGHKNSSSI